MIKMGFKTEKAVYREAYMNDVNVLLGFMRMLGIPKRPYKEIMHELSLEVQEKKNEKYITKLN